MELLLQRALVFRTIGTTIHFSVVAQYICLEGVTLYNSCLINHHLLTMCILSCSAAQYTDGLMPANAMITSEGNVFWPVPTKLQSTCKVDVTYFPFDEQTCRLKFGSWT